MKTANVVFASALMLSVVAPTLSHAAYFVDQTKIWATNAPAPAQNVTGKRMRGTNAMAFVPADVADRYSRDFGIGSQR